MKSLIISFMFFLSLSLSAQEVRVMNWETFESEILNSSDSKKIKVINFWATWCKPCLEELPAFEALNKEWSDSVEVILVSLDSEDRLETNVRPFVTRKKLRSQVILLNDVDFNSWLPKIDKTWGGELPATYILHGTKKVFHASKLTKEELISLISKTK